MITELLTINEKKALISLSKKLINADGIIATKEKQVYEIMLELLSIKRYKINNKTSVKSLCNTFKTQRSRIICLLELIGIAWVDNSFQKKEKEFINEVCDNFGINRLKIKSYTKLSKNMIRLNQELISIGKKS